MQTIASWSTALLVCLPAFVVARAAAEPPPDTGQADASQADAKQVEPNEPPPDPKQVELDQLRARLQRVEQEQREQNGQLQRDLDTLRERLDESELREATQRAEQEQRRRLLSIYGWADFAFTYLPGLGSGHALYSYLNDRPLFAVGNINLIFDARPWKGWRVLFEPRFTYAPDGNVSNYEIAGLSSFERFSTALIDPATQTGLVSWGGVVIDRVWAAWEPRDWFKVLVGNFLTPYGIWNIDHGTPVITSVRPPLLVSLQILPPRLTGIKLYGSVFAAEEQLDYSVYLSNGRGPIANSDLDSNKAVGGRLKLTTRRLGKLELGMSFFVGRYTDEKLAVDGSQPVEAPILPPLERTVTTQFDEYDLAFDLKWDYRSFGLRSELAYSAVKFDDAARPTAYINPTFNLALGQGLAPLADYSVLASYTTLLYHLPWFNITPYARFEWTDPNSNVSFDNVININLGLNIRLAPPIIFKAEYQQFFFVEDGDFTVDPERLGAIDRGIRVFSTQLALRF